MDFKKYWALLTEICKAHPKGKPYREGLFYPDPTPVAPPAGMSQTADIDMFEVMRLRIRNEGSILAQMQGQESFDEANDFNVDEDPEPFSPWEVITEQFVPDGPVTSPEAPKPAPAAVTSPPLAPVGASAPPPGDK